MSYASRHNTQKWRLRPRSYDRNLALAYQELPEESQRLMDAAAHREAIRALEEEQMQRGSYSLSEFRCELSLEKAEQLERLIVKGCGGRLQELAEKIESEDGPEERLEWAFVQLQANRRPGYVRPRSLAEWLGRFAGRRGGDPQKIGESPGL